MHGFDLEFPIIDGVRHKKNPFRGGAIVQEVFSGPLSDRQTGVKSWNETSIGKRFESSLGHAARRVQMGVASDHDFDFRPPTSPDRLPRTSVMPTIHQHRVVFVPLNDPLNFRRVEPANPSLIPRTGHVLQKGIPVPFEQGHIPVEFHAKSSVGLFPRRRLVAVVDVEV